MKIINQVSAGGIVYKKDKNNQYLWLICQHSQHKGWVFPKGLVGDINPNEDKIETALREVEEEGGVKAKIIDNNPIITQYQYKYENNLYKKTVFYYLMEYVSGDPKNHDWEMSDAKFVTTEEALKTLTYPSEKKAFLEILKKLNLING